MATKIVCWNIAKRHEPWRELMAMDADVALLQEAGQVPEDVASQVETDNADLPDDLYDRWPIVAKLSDRVEVEWFKPVSPMKKPASDEIPVSDVSTIAAARVIPQGAEPFIVVSMNARWVMPHSSTGTKWGVGHPDGSAHRILSDLSGFSCRYPTRLRLCVARLPRGSHRAGNELSRRMGQQRPLPAVDRSGLDVNLSSRRRHTVASPSAEGTGFEATRGWARRTMKCSFQVKSPIRKMPEDR